jgi:hypothetical protein
LHAAEELLGLFFAPEHNDYRVLCQLLRRAFVASGWNASEESWTAGDTPLAKCRVRNPQRL